MVADPAMGAYAAPLEVVADLGPHVGLSGAVPCEGRVVHAEFRCMDAYAILVVWRIF